MIRIFFCILSIIFIANSAAASSESSQTDNSNTITYTTFAVGLLLKNTLSHYSKKYASTHLVRSVLLRSSSDLVALFLLKEAGEFAFQSFANIAPDWLKPKKNKQCETENLSLKQELEVLKLKALSTSEEIQIERINFLKNMFLSSELKISLNKITGLLHCSFKLTCPDNSLEISNTLIELSETILNLYPGFTVDDMTAFRVDLNFKPFPTGEQYTYDENLIRKTAKEFHLKSRLSEKSILYLSETLLELIKERQSGKAEYFQHLWDLLGIDINLPEPITQPDL